MSYGSSTLVYTYWSGSQTRWVATRYVGFWGSKTAGAEATESLAMYG